MAYVKKSKKDPRDEYKVKDTYDENATKTRRDIITSDEFIEIMYKLVIKYS